MKNIHLKYRIEWTTESKLVLTMVILLYMALVAPVNAQTMAPHLTNQQADIGKAAFERYCTECHGQNLIGGQFGPALKGSNFVTRWGGKSVAELFFYTATRMPTLAPHSLTNETYLNLVAYILKSNGVRSGEEPLPADQQALAALVLPSASGGPGGGITSGVILPPPPHPRKNPLDGYTKITDGMLADVPAGDWLTWRRGSDAVGFSPLKQINWKNIKRLHTVWTWTLPTGPNQVTPLIHDGVMFVDGFGDVVQALDAASGDLLWQYTRWLPDTVRDYWKRKHGIAVYGDSVFIATADSHMVALDARTGSVRWDSPVGDLDKGYGIVGGPLVAKGKVMIGTQGFAPGGNYIVAFDTETGQEAWRFYAIARPGEPGGNSWNGLPLEKRNGASIWLPGSYDPQTGLALFGPGQTYDTEPLRIPSTKPGVTNDALYTDSTVALDPDTGRLVWHYQHLRSDQWDLDWAMERQVLNLKVKGKRQRVVVTAGKQAIYDVLEADTGKYLFSIDLGLQNLVKSIDPVTGEKHIDPDLIPGPDKQVMVCPHAGGSKNWIPGSFNPDTAILYVPLTESCMDLIPIPKGEPPGLLSSGVQFSLRPPPGHDGRYGRLEAVNLQSRKSVWIKRQRAPFTSGALATAGGIVFAGDLDRYFSAYRARDGLHLWQVRLNDVPNTAPVSYMVDGVQYIAIVVGHGGPISVDRIPLVPEIHIPPDTGALVWVFALQD